MSIFSVIGGLIKPIGDIVDNLHTSGEEKAEAVLALQKVQNAVTAKILDYESKLLEAQSSIIVAEASGQSWIQRNWRPITMLTFLVLVVCDSFGLLAFRLAAEAWTLLQLGLGGYVVGRSAEKIVPSILEKFSGKK
ncbi:hypothetical protein LCGC14_1228260 [marine sediment metagenome]|uniref:Holin of 3TMs, for gene-transfer release n=1 Tax=marine sediment metagenome TaxID=412755 RepID=A0A0F9L983_9ZZZZ